MLLEGEALAIWLEEQRKNYEFAKSETLATIMPMGFVAVVGGIPPLKTARFLSSLTI